MIAMKTSAYTMLNSNTTLLHGFLSGKCMTDWKLRGGEQPSALSTVLAVRICEWIIRAHDVNIRGNNSVATAIEVSSCQPSSSACGS